MDSWIIVLLFKPLALLGVAGAYYLIVYKSAKWLEKRFPDGRLKHALFRERGTYDTRPTADRD